MKTILDVINAVDEKFSSADKWTKRMYARDRAGLKVSETSPKATCWCLDGCIIALTATHPYPHVAIANQLGNDVLVFLNNKLNVMPKTVSGRISFRFDWNDAPERTFADIKNLLAECKKELEA